MIRAYRFVLSLLGLALASGTARADVLEIGAAGATWVAGGPQAAAQSVTSAAGATPPLSPVADTAGPDQWRPHVARIAAKYDLSPQLLEALVWQESRWRTNAISPAGARGLAQLMPGTARELGVNPDDPLANLEGGARYLRQQLNTFGGDLEKALAAYNAGPNRVIRAGGIPNIRETQGYVAAIMARLAQPVRR
ncbi:MAG: lytic transglycosylase domain-containing protein [Pseudomonadota bacterium]